MSDSKNKFDPNTDILDLSGKVYVVTGGSAGIGESDDERQTLLEASIANMTKAMASAPIFSNTTAPSSTCLARRRSILLMPKKA